MAYFFKSAQHGNNTVIDNQAMYAQSTLSKS